MQVKRSQRVSVFVLGIFLAMAVQLQGCKMRILPQEERSEVTFTIISKECIPDTLAKLIEERKEEARKKIAELDPIIQDLESIVEEAEIRLDCLYYKEREVLYAYYVENRTAEDISQNLYFKLFSRTCSPRYIRNLIKESTEKILKL